MKPCKVKGEKQLREHGPCMEDIWLLASAGAMLGLQRNSKAKHCSCCERLNEKSNLWKIKMLNIQYMFRRVTGTSNNSQKQTEHSTCFYAPQYGMHIMFSARQDFSTCFKDSPKKSVFSSPDVKLKMQRKELHSHH